MEQRIATPTTTSRVESWVIRVGTWVATAAVAILGISMSSSISEFFGQTEAERAAEVQWQIKYRQEEFEDYERAYAAKCSSYPSSECSALIDFDDDSAPCFVGQVKANRRSGVYHTPQSPWYGRTNADVLCFKTPALASQAGYRPARGTGN